jgi:hypothetical protein
MAYALLGAACALAVAVFLLGISRHANIAPAVNAAECCWAPQGKETRCYPCRPTRETQTPR